MLFEFSADTLKQWVRDSTEKCRILTGSATNELQDVLYVKYLVLSYMARG
jgi:hypothetical protein